MANSLQTGSLRIATVMGIPIRVHYSWLIIFGLITWSLSTYYFPKAAPELPGAAYWLSGAAAALLLFISVALHELSHSFVAKKYGIEIAGITLFIFGGVAQMKGEPESPEVEMKMALAGPLSSYALAGFFYAAYIFSPTPSLKALFRYIFILNLVLGTFNLIPGFPMDGGRVVRAIIWRRTRDFIYATRKASNYGQRVALFFIIFGVFSIFIGVSGGLWLMLIGWFLYTAAQSSFQQASFQEALRGVKVKDVMAGDLVSIAPDVSLETAINEYFLKYGYGGFPVVDKGKFLGLITLRECKGVPRGQWGETPVSKVYLPHDVRLEVSAHDEAVKALELMAGAEKGRIAVIGKGALVGMVTKNGIAKYIQMMSEIRG